MSTPTNMPARDRAHLRRAAVSIPVLLHEGEHVVLLTQRPEGLSAHPGEICFPGGKVDAADASPLAAACRELDEEVGIPARHVLAYRAEQGAVTSSGFYIEPFVMRIASGADIRPNEREVSRCCFLPLTAALVLENYRIEKFSIPRDDFGFVFPTPIGPVRGATCTLLLHLVKQVLRFGSFGEYARTFEDLPGTR
jgi:8-oxo-dGTP pyrophosphatase MutT (NUDIX family)